MIWIFVAFIVGYVLGSGVMCFVQINAEPDPYVYDYDKFLKYLNEREERK